MSDTGIPGYALEVYLTSAAGKMFEVGVDEKGRLTTRESELEPPQNWNPLNDDRLDAVQAEVVTARGTYPTLDARLDAMDTEVGSLPFSAITDKPTTVAGYGITDALKTTGGTSTGPIAAPNFVGKVNGVNYTVAATAPAGPAVNDMWVDTTSSLFKRWSGAAWVTIGGGGSGGGGDMLKSTYDVNNNGIVDASQSVPFTGITGKPTTVAGYGITDALTTSGGTVNGSITATNFIGDLNGVLYTVSGTAPASPAVNDMWVDTVNSAFKRWSGAAWIAIGGSGGGGGTGTVIAASLPAPSATNRGQLYLITGASGVADALYVCMKFANNAYDWVQIR